MLSGNRKTQEANAGCRNTPTKAVLLGKAQILGQASPQEKRRLGLRQCRRPRRTPCQICLDPDCATRPGQRYGAADDPALQDYWTNRRSRRHAELSGSQQALAKEQRGLCFHCGESLHNDEALCVHYIKSRRLGGERAIDNQRLMHLYCHLQALAFERSVRERKRFA
jgi:RNA-directed DNA polymerase